MEKEKQEKHDKLYQEFPEKCSKVARQFTGGEITAFEVVAWITNYLQELEAINAAAWELK